MVLDRLDQLESDSVFILREAFSQVSPLAMLWSLGKDSNVMLWLARKAFLGHIPFPVVHLDTGAEFPEAYTFRDRYAVDWGLRLIRETCPPIETVDPALPAASRFAARKSAGLRQFLVSKGIKGVFAGIRRDEQALRAKERVFSPRNADGTWNFRDQPAEFWQHFVTSVRPDEHLRIHPLLQWTELDIWLYIERENIPVVPLYFARDGKRFRSLGEIGITQPISSSAESIQEIIAELRTSHTEERQGRVMDHESEDAFERLRLNGYL
jgi:sulfate adenylyltransferase subunit 2